MIIIAVVSFHSCHFHEVSFILLGVLLCYKGYKLSTNRSCICPCSTRTMGGGGITPYIMTHLSLNFNASTVVYLRSIASH